MWNLGRTACQDGWHGIAQLCGQRTGRWQSGRLSSDATESSETALTPGKYPKVSRHSRTRNQASRATAALEEKDGNTFITVDRLLRERI